MITILTLKIQMTTRDESSFNTINEYYNGLVVNVRDYTSTINYSTNLDTRQFNIIKSKYKILSQMIMSYVITQEYLNSNATIANIVENMQSFSDIIDRTELIIFTRNNELKYNVSKLIEELRTSTHTNSDNINRLTRTIGIYNELEF